MQRLRAALRVHDGKPLMNENGAVIDMYAIPIGTTMALAMGALQCFPSELDHVIAGLQPEYSKY
jgi:hypothetical protein